MGASLRRFEIVPNSDVGDANWDFEKELDPVQKSFWIFNRCVLSSFEASVGSQPGVARVVRLIHLV